MVGVQATANVLAGERYKNISKEVKNYIKGEYGKAPGKINEELQKKVLGDEEPITCRYADLLEPGLPAAMSISATERPATRMFSPISLSRLRRKHSSTSATRERRTLSHTR